MCQLLDSPFIVNLHYTFQTDTELYFVMDPCIGGTLFSYLGRLPSWGLLANSIKFYISEIIIAIEQIHNKDMIFRDLKPENVLIDIDGHIKLVDFGFSKELSQNEMNSSFCGSIEYLPPEMVRGDEYYKSVDFYTIGWVLYRMIVGYPPFWGPGSEEIYERIVNEPLSFPQNIEK